MSFSLLFKLSKSLQTDGYVNTRSRFSEKLFGKYLGFILSDKSQTSEVHVRMVLPVPSTETSQFWSVCKRIDYKQDIRRFQKLCQLGLGFETPRDFNQRPLKNLQYGRVYINREE